MPSVVPAIIPESVDHLKLLSQRMATIAAWQIDLVDNFFASSVSWPYRNNDAVTSADTAFLRTLCHTHDIDVDLMVGDPLTVGVRWLELGAKQLTVHVESMKSLADFKQLQSQYDFRLSLSLNNDTDVDRVLTHISAVGPPTISVQCMGIAQIGSQGQPFDDRVIGHIEAIKKHNKQTHVTVDGSVNAVTIPTLRAAGVDRFVVGSAIVKQPDPTAAHQTLSELVRSL